MLMNFRSAHAWGCITGISTETVTKLAIKVKKYSDCCNLSYFRSFYSRELAGVWQFTIFYFRFKLGVLIYGSSILIHLNEQ